MEANLTHFFTSQDLKFIFTPSLDIRQFYQIRAANWVKRNTSYDAHIRYIRRDQQDYLCDR